MAETIRLPHSLAFRLDDASFAQLSALADRLGIKPSVLARDAVIALIGGKLPRPKRTEIPAAAELRDLLIQIRRIGTNANQIARLMNQGASGGAAAADIAALRAQIDTMTKAVLDAMGIEATA